MRKIIYNQTPQEAAKIYADLIDGLPLGICRTDAEGKIVYCNLQFAKIFQKSSQEELLRLPVSDLYRDKGDSESLVSSLGEKEMVSDVPIPFSTCEGKPIWCWVAAKAGESEEGCLDYIDICLDEIDDKVERRRKVQEKAGQEGLKLVFDLKGVLLDANDVVCETLGCSRDDLVGKNLQEIAAPGKSDTFLWILYEALEKGQSRRMLTFVDDSEGLRFFDLTAKLLQTQGNPGPIEATGWDLTHRFRRLKIEERRERFLGVREMARAVTQNVEQPLQIVKLLLDEMLDGIEPENSAHEKVTRMLDQVINIEDIVDKIKSIKKYRSMDYVAGIRIFDIDGSVD
jgi:PAS domain S-box-containing protein